MPVQIQLRHDTAANWTAANPTLALGEIGLETDTVKFKVGDGATAWIALGYGIAGDPGTPGSDGSPGVGVPPGGIAGQRLSKIDGTDYNTEWVTPGDAITEITTIPTAETDTALVLAPDGAGGVGFRAEAGGGGGGATGARLPVQEKGSGGSNTSTPGCTMDATPTVGNLLLCCVESEGGYNVTSITQSNVTWTKLYGSTASVAPVVELWKGVIASSAGTAVTVNLSGGSQSAMTVSEWSGLAGTIDQSATHHGTSEPANNHPVAFIAPTDVTALVVCVASMAGWSTTFVQFCGAPLWPFLTAAGGGFFWGFPGLIGVSGIANSAGSGNGTSSSITVSLT